MTPRPFEFMDALKFGLNALWNNIVRLLLVYGATLLAGLGLAGLFAMGGRFASYLGNWLVLHVFVLIVLGMALRFAIYMVLDRVALDAVENKKTDFRDLVPLFGTYVLAVVLFSALTFLGCILLLVPGIIWFIKYNFADLIVLDTGMDTLDAFKRSAQLTYGHKWYLLGVFLLALLLMIISVITVIGPFVLMFAYMFSRAYIYRKLVESHNADLEQFTAVPPVSA